jgi:hypothetical protein
MHPTAAMKRVRPAVFALALAACATAPARYEPGTPTAEQTAKLKAAEAAYRAGAADYPTQRDAIARDPVAAAWLARMFVREVFTAREGRPLGEDDELLRAAAGIEDPVVARAIAELRALGAVAVPVLVGDLLHHEQAQPRELGIELLGEIGEPARPALLALLRGAPEKPRRAAARALGRLGVDDEVFAALAAMAREPDFTVRADALRSLRGGGAPAQAFLIERLRADDDPYVRRVAAETLVAFPTTAVANALVDHLERCERDGDRASSRAAQRALCTMAGVRAARPAEQWRQWAAGVDARAAAKPAAKAADAPR